MTKILIGFLVLLVIGLVLFSVDYFVHTPAPSVVGAVVDRVNVPGQDPRTNVGLVMNTNGNAYDLGGKGIDCENCGILTPDELFEIYHKNPREEK